MPAHSKTFVASMIVWLGLVASGPVRGQTVPMAPESRAGLLPQLPLTPEFPPRPATNSDFPWRSPSEQDTQPTASFIDSLKGTDVALELVVQQGRLLTLRQPLATEDGVAVIAVGDPTVIDFEVLPDQRMLRLTGKRVGVTDLSFLTADGSSYAIEVHVGYDLVLIRAQLKQLFPDAQIQLRGLREHVIVEGQARSVDQIQQITTTILAYLESAQTSRAQTSQRGAAPIPVPDDPNATVDPDAIPDQELPEGDVAPLDGDDDLPIGLAYEQGARPSSRSSSAAPQLINLMRVPGSQQVMLKVTIAELNRSAFRAVGVDLAVDGNDAFFESLFTGAGNVTVIGTEVATLMNLLRNNSISTILAEPNLVTLSGHPAQFLAGGEFAVPVTQPGNFNFTVEFKPFGIQLTFVPYVMDDGVIRLTVRPEVSNPDDVLGTQVQGTQVPGLRSRNASSTVELREGETLAMAGLLNRTTQANASRFPLLGDLPLLGNAFRSTDHEVQETELLVLVTPYIVGGMDDGHLIPLPGQEIMEPNDLELYLLGRIEGRTGLPHRSTTNWDDPLGCIRQQQIEKQHVFGPFGFSK